MRKSLFRKLILYAGLLLASSPAFADVTKLAADLLSLLANPLGTSHVVIQFKNAPTSLDLLQITTLGGKITNQYTSLPALSGQLSNAVVLTLSDLLNIAYMTPDRVVSANLDYSAAAVNASAAQQYGLDGSGIGVAIIDSGIYEHPDLAKTTGGSRVVYHQSFVPKTNLDDFGHGTHVAGIVGGSGKSSLGFGHVLRGIAPNANLIDLWVLDSKGGSSDIAVILAIDRTIQLKNTHNIRVINLSLGRRVFESSNLDPLCQAVDEACRKGIVVVAAGNLARNGYATILSPGNTPAAITVGAMKTLATYSRTDDLVASYSSKGPTVYDMTVKPDLMAPGNLVVSLLVPNSTLAADFQANVVSGGYLRLSGTSMATPVVSGAVADLVQHDPTLTPDTIKARLMKTAYKSFPATSTAYEPTTGVTHTSQFDIYTIGAGYLDIAAALASDALANASARSPRVRYDAVAKQAYVISDPTRLWGNTVAWGDAATWGTNVFQPGSTVATWGTAPTLGTGGNGEK
jgi:serine protease AprX